jgi:hypothetical protein
MQAIPMSNSKRFVAFLLIGAFLFLDSSTYSFASNSNTRPNANSTKPAYDTFGDPLFDKRNNKAVDPWLITFAGYLAYADNLVSSGKYDFNALIQVYFNIRGNLYEKRYSYLNILTPEEQNLGVKQSDPKPSEFLDLWSEKTKLWYCYADIRYLDNKPYTGKPLRHRLILDTCEKFLSSHTLTLPSVLKDSYVKSPFDSYTITTHYPTIRLRVPLNNLLAQVPLAGSDINFVGVINDNSKIKSIEIRPTTTDSDRYGIIFTTSEKAIPQFLDDEKTYSLTIPLDKIILEYKSKNSLTTDPACGTSYNNQIWRLKFTVTMNDDSVSKGYFDTYINRNSCLN